MLFIITGNGKGKTTSAIGTAIRNAGWGKKTAIIFFDKGGDHYGEQNIFDLLKDKIDVFRFGCERFDAGPQTFRFENTPDDIAEAKRAMEKATELMARDYSLIICDEIINCMNNGLVEEEDVQRLVMNRPNGTHLMMTGRNAPEWLTSMADLVSDVREVKHYFRKKGGAIEGIDY